MHASLLLWAALGAVGLRLFWAVYSHATSPLRDVPGPWLARYTNLWYFYRIWTGKAHHVNIAVHRQYAPPGKFYAEVVRIGPNLYSITTPEKAIYGIGSKMPKSSWYEGWKHPSPDRWTTFPDRDIKRHAETRRKFQAIYSLSSLVSYEKYVDDCADIFQQRLTEAASEGNNIDMAHWFQCYAFDVIGDLTYSKRFGFLDEGKDMGGTMAALNRAMVYGTLVGVYAWAHPFLYSIMEKIPSSGAAGRNYIMKFVRERVSRREIQRQDKDTELKAIEEADENAPQDFLDKLLNMQADGSKGVTPYHVFMMGLSNIIAGSDTTAVSLSSILYHLLKFPKTMEKLRGELESFERDDRCEKDRVSFKDSQNMPYLQACIKEGLRLHAATGLPLWRVVPEGGAELCGHFFPAGSEVGINTWVAHYDEDVWGSDAKDFRPERWIEAEAEGGSRLKELETYYMPFGLGSRTCLGRHISYLEMSKLIPQLVRTFDFELEKPSKDWETQNFWFVKPMDFKLRVKRRAVLN